MQVVPKLEEVRKDGVWQEQQWHNAYEFLVSHFAYALAVKIATSL